MAYDFYFAGTQCVEADDEICRLNGNVLKSYTNDQAAIKRWIERRKDGWTGKLMIDNGAFTVHRQGGAVDIDEYISWLNENDEYIDYAIALDSIPGVWGQKRTREMVIESADITYNNYLYMLDRVKSPHKLLPVYHQGEPFTYLEQFLAFDDLEYMCISGSKDVSAKERDPWFAKCFDVIHRSKNPDIKIHFLGIATAVVAEKFPITSMDATSWIMTGAAGSILTEYGVVYVGDGCKSLEAMAPQAKESIQAISNRYGLSVDELGTDYKKRMIFNVNYLVEQSRLSIYRGYRKVRRLF